jgi:hypothetical protein
MAQEVKSAASDVLASLHLINGKAQIPIGWSTEMKSALGVIGLALNGLAGEGWLEEPISVTPPLPPAGVPQLPMDPVERLPVALDYLKGGVEMVLALLR